ITEAQKDWFFSILDEMEEAHVIQRVPGEFIKGLSSTNIQPKEAGKIGATHNEILQKVTAECIKNGLPPFWEEVCKPGKTDKAMLENRNGTGQRPNGGSATRLPHSTKPHKYPHSPK